MPTYDYRCDINDRVVEVSHRMSETIANWGDLCARAGVELGGTPADAPVHRLATGGNPPRLWRRRLLSLGDVRLLIRTRGVLPPG